MTAGGKIDVYGHALRFWLRSHRFTATWVFLSAVIYAVLAVQYH